MHGVVQDFDGVPKDPAEFAGTVSVVVDGLPRPVVLPRQTTEASMTAAVRDVLGDVDAQDCRTSTITTAPMDSLFEHSFAISLEIESQVMP